jgi:Na+/H+-dicarboxylate symporter
MFWIVITFIVGIALGIVLGDMLNHETFKELFVINDHN